MKGFLSTAKVFQLSRISRSGHLAESTRTLVTRGCKRQAHAAAESCAEEAALGADITINLLIFVLAQFHLECPCDNHMDSVNSWKS